MTELWCPILPDCYLSCTVPLLHAYVCNIKDPKMTGKVIQLLNSKYPEPNLSHLKRVNSNKKEGKLQVLLTDDKHKLDEILQSFSSVGILIDDPSYVQVPAESGKTKEQHLFAMTLWPVAVFTADKYLESVLEGKNFSFEQRKEIERLMGVALQAAEKSRKLGGKGVGAVVAFRGEVLGVGCDARNKHPLKHAAIAMLDMVSWVKHGQKDEERPEWAGDDLVECQAQVLKSPKSYLCTDYDVYLTREPCTFCAMALLHNRVKRIFYGCPSEEGALGTREKLHTLPGINHRYEVFANVRGKECGELLTKCEMKHKCFS
ncbi:probable inactive tRNA-specific adenosine deaminase-like protein 3 isoform X1 [Neocloeon triangulifer]|uniref:probable inactive tRNA-specific adenosine deaminase-like protein 3 isoform X1 n=1 Tax=Neocloeon triangulifer TaxID=2078957 RepID=UPI00286F3A34|nr:probable inactive tRNA-specific adenosine deaminase-like protein 3 isoform X1 [Neocloeon triangulifer]XP_059483333.1 probable inactive tRNA-specific adenosine deaminase-like protein 3 isoform X1 [Neocloeon triangulifer]